MLPLGRPMTSAATPLFQQMPSATLHLPESREHRRSHGPQAAAQRQTEHLLPFSSSCGSAARMPVRTAPWHRKHHQKADEHRRRTPHPHQRARMMKLATGVALTSAAAPGRSKTSAAGPDFSRCGQRRALHTTPSPKPSRMRPALKPTPGARNPPAAATAAGSAGPAPATPEASCPMAMAAACHTASQNSTAPARRSSVCSRAWFSPFRCSFLPSQYTLRPRPMTCASPAREACFQKILLFNLDMLDMNLSSEYTEDIRSLPGRVHTRGALCKSYRRKLLLASRPLISMFFGAGNHNLSAGPGGQGRHPFLACLSGPLQPSVPNGAAPVPGGGCGPGPGSGKAGRPGAPVPRSL